MLRTSNASGFKPVTAADHENLGLRTNPLVVAMDGFADKKSREVGTQATVPNKKFRGLDLLAEYRDKAKAVWGPDEFARDGFKVLGSGALWQGFLHRWMKRPHRLSEEASSLRNVVYDRRIDAVTYESASSFRVGAYADVGEVAVNSAVFKGDGLSFHYGTVGEERLRVTGRVGEEKIVRVHERVDLAQAGLADSDRVSVVLNGFSLRCLNYAGGYNTRGYGVRVVPVGIKDGAFEFDVEFRIHPEHAPDRPQPDDYYVGAPSKDGTYPMLSIGGHVAAYLRWIFAPIGKLTGLWSAAVPDDHLERYEYAARVDYAVIGAVSGKAAMTDAAERPTNSYPQKADLGLFHRRIPPVEGAVKKSSVLGEPGFAHGVAAIQGFTWHLEGWDPTKKDGRYIRTLELRLENVEYDQASGRADFQTLMGFSNESPFPSGFDARYAMWVSLIQFGDAEQSEPLALRHTGHLENEEARYRETVNHVWPS
jgi:hypothetical protein